MDETKVWYQSRTIIGSIVTILALLAGFFNLTITTEDQNGIVELVMVAVGVVSSIFAIWGRVRASKTIK